LSNESCLLCTQLLHHLQDVVTRRNESGNPIDTRLHQVSQDLHSLIAKHLQVSLTLNYLMECSFHNKIKGWEDIK